MVSSASLPSQTMIGFGPHHEPSSQGASATLRPLADAKILEAEWSALADQAAEPNSFGEYWFVARSLATLGRGLDIRLADVRHEGRLIGALPLIIEQGYGRMPVRFVQNWCHYHLFLGTPLVVRGHEKMFWRALLEMLDRSKWATGFFHLRGLVEQGPLHCALEEIAREDGRDCAVVHRRQRAFLDRTAAPAFAIRPKKAKELRRLTNRLGEQGDLNFRRLERMGELDDYCSAFLRLEQAGWKGAQGSALASSPATERFFCEAIAAAFRRDRLDFLRLDLDDRPIAMLVNFLAPPGSFSFKTCFDEAFARFSPGVLLQIENLNAFDRLGVDWADSCAAENHPMIDSLWPGRRSTVRVSVELKGFKRAMKFHACRTLETGAAFTRGLMKRTGA